MADTFNFVATAGSNTIDFDASGVVTTATDFTGTVNQTGERGDQGDSAYQVWLDAGNTGTVDDFLDSLTNNAARQADFIVAPYGSGQKANYYVQGATNAEVTIQQAIDAAAALPKGGSVYLKSGYYGISAQIVPKSNVKLYSDGSAILQNVVGFNGQASDKIDAAPIVKDNGNAFADFIIEGIEFIGNRTLGSTSCAIYLTGSNDPNNPGSPVISDLVIRNCRFLHMQLLPVKIFGLSGEVMVTGCHFEDNADPGFGFNEEFRLVNNFSKNSHDNGFSISRGNGNVTVVGNTVQDPNLYGLWMGGYNTDAGPHEFACVGNTVKGCRRSCISVEGGATNGVISGNYLEFKTKAYGSDLQGDRPLNTNSHVDGIEVYGDSTIQQAMNIAITGNTIRYAPRSGISLANAVNISISGNLILNIGNEYFGNGTTPITSTDTTSNIGIFSAQLNNKRVWVGSNSIVDDRTSPLMNYDIWKLQSTAGGIIEGQNYSSGMRNDRNRVDLINVRYETGSDIAWSVNGPDPSPNWLLNLQGTGALILRHNGGALNVNNVNTSGSGTQSKIDFSAGLSTSMVGRIYATRNDASSSTRIGLLPLANGALMSSSPFEITGNPSANSAYTTLNSGLVFKRRAVADASTSPSAYDYLIEFTSLTAARDVSLPVAATVPTGSTILIKDGVGLAGTYNLTVKVVSSGTIDGVATKVINMNYGQILVYNNGTEWKVSGGLYNTSQVSGGGAVSSVFTRTGSVVAASGDYTASQVTSTPVGNIAATDVQTAINELDTEKVAISGDTMTGKLVLPNSTTSAAPLNIGTTGTAPTTPVAGDLWYNGSFVMGYVQGSAQQIIVNNATQTLNNKVLGTFVPSANVTQSIGSASLYWLNTYSQKVFFNSTATLDGTTAGIIALTGLLNVNGSVAQTNSLDVSVSTGITRADASTNGPALRMYKRGTTGDATAAVKSGNNVFTLEGYGYNGTNYSHQATISINATQDWNATDRGASMSFLVTPNGSTSRSTAFMLGQNSQATFSGDISIADTKNIIVSSTTGTKIGTSTTQKLGFYNSTPIVQPTGNILTALSNLGLVGTPTLAKADAGLGNVDDTSDATKNSATATLTNKRVTPRTGTITSTAAPAINTDSVDFYSITALAVDITGFTMSGTPTDGQKLWISITGTTARAITWGSSFESSTVTLPTTTVSTNRLDVGFIWNVATSKWRCMAAA